MPVCNWLKMSVGGVKKLSGSRIKYKRTGTGSGYFGVKRGKLSFGADFQNAWVK
jgi:hypothetical protein